MGPVQLDPGQTLEFFITKFVSLELGGDHRQNIQGRSRIGFSRFELVGKNVVTCQGDRACQCQSGKDQHDFFQHYFHSFLHGFRINRFTEYDCKKFILQIGI